MDNLSEQLQNTKNPPPGEVRKYGKAMGLTNVLLRLCRPSNSIHSHSHPILLQRFCRRTRPLLPLLSAKSGCCQAPDNGIMVNNSSIEHNSTLARADATSAPGESTGESIIAPELTRVEHAEIAARLKAGLDKAVIIDVRDEKEVAAGRIKASINVPSAVFKADDKGALDEVIRDKLGDAREVVMHCQLSAIRGPTCAKALNDRLKALGIKGVEVKVLKGGIAGFMTAHGSDPDLVVVPEGGWADQPH